MPEALYMYSNRILKSIFDPHRGRMYVVNVLFYKYMNPMGSLT